MREIRVSWNKCKSRWQVLVPAELSGTGKRKRRFFVDEKDARTLAERINTDRGSITELFHRLDPKAQETILRCLHRVDNDASQIEQALDAWLKKKHVETTVTLGHLRDECVESKVKANCRTGYIANFKNSLKAFVDPRKDLLISEVTPKLIEEWLHGNGWATATKQGILKDVRTMFSFALRREYLANNPAERVERPKDDEEKPVGIWTVEQVKKVMARAAESDPPLARWLAIQLFGGLRKSEAKRLTEADIKAEIFVSSKTKTRQKRWVSINDTLKAWLALDGKLPLKNVVRRLRRVRGEIKKVAGRRGPRLKHVVDVPYPRNCLRSSFCSYALPVFGAKVAATQAGHDEDVFFADYRELVTLEAAREFWNITPESITKSPAAST